MSRVRVPSSLDMDDDVFREHMNHRHYNEMGDPINISDKVRSWYVYRLWRSYHKHIHQAQDGHDHTHLPPEQDYYDYIPGQS